MRLFVAVPLPEGIEEQLEALIDELRQTVPSGVRWVPAKNIHLTLKFLGEQPVAVIRSISSVVAEAAAEHFSFPLAVGGLGCFPNPQRPRVLWVGLQDQTNQLSELQHRLEAGFEQMGIPLEQHRFHPHLTIGRVRKDASRSQQQALADAVRLGGAPSLGRFNANEIVLFQSDLRPQGAVYSRVETFSLGGLR